MTCVLSCKDQRIPRVVSGARPSQRARLWMVGLPLGVAYSQVLAAVQLGSRIALLCPSFSLESQTLASAWS